MAKPESTTDNDSVILVDGSSYVYRAYHALPPLSTSTGQPTGAVRGVTTMVMRILEDHPDSPVGMIFDAKGTTFRNDMYDQYKANRPPMPDDLRPQIQPIYDICEALGLKIFVVDNVEADDVIGTLATQAEAQGIKTVVSTGDKDLAQLVTKNIRLVNTMSNEVLDEAGVMKKFGVKPNQIIDYLALVGDTSDNIPGVQKVGPKTAVNWLTKYETVENIITNAEEITGKVGEYLREGIEQLKLSQQLTTIKKGVELDFGINDLPMIGVAKGVDRDHGKEEFHRIGQRPFALRHNDPVLYFIQRLRDEAHRFAIGTHRAKRAKTITATPLDEVPGVGAGRKKALLSHFGSAKAVSRANLIDLKAVDGISSALAETIYAFFNDRG